MKHADSHAKKSFLRFFVLAGVTAIIVLCVYLLWSGYTKNAEIERRALAEARTLYTEIDATWDYIDSLQPRSNRVDIDTFPKGMYCAVAAKNIAKRFSQESDYSIRYIRENPRNKDDSPDDFEHLALTSFETNDDSEYYSVVEQEDGMMFRYVSVLRIEQGCLSCHGDPTGEKDVLGYLKEGMQVNEIGGAVSIVMPMDTILSEANQDMVGTVIFFCVLMGTMGILLLIALRRWVARPILSENERLIHESEEQSKFLAIVSHELKTPLSSILAYADLLKTEEKHQSHIHSKEQIVSEIETNGHVLLDMVNNLLDAAKIEAGALSLTYEELDVFDVVALVHSAVDNLADKRRIHFVVQVQPDIPILHGDIDALRRIAINLISNSLRFTHEGGTIELRISYSDDKLVVEVEDTGYGIPEKQLSSLFNRFESTPGSESTSEGGAGLGLYIVKSFADMLHGSVEVRSKIGRGSLFIVSLPLRALDEAGEDDKTYD